MSQDPRPASSLSVYDRIYAQIRLIPRGVVATYGQIAEQAGISGPRQVGYALSALPAGSDVPWHRVINAKGEVSTRSVPGCEQHQRQLLEAEGVTLDARDRISLERYRWRPLSGDESEVAFERFRRDRRQ